MDQSDIDFNLPNTNLVELGCRGIKISAFENATDEDENVVTPFLKNLNLTPPPRPQNYKSFRLIPESYNPFYNLIMVHTSSNCKAFQQMQMYGNWKQFLKRISLCCSNHSEGDDSC